MSEQGRQWTWKRLYLGLNRRIYIFHLEIGRLAITFERKH